MIDFVVKRQWAGKETGKLEYCYTVYYKRKDNWRGDRKYNYSHLDNLPLTVLNFVLNAGSCETVYIPENEKRGLLGYRKEIYRK
jgi:hypothetical protein